jgi:alkylation response protein AidB-like acyl-CoA dehydrogenase
MGANAVALMGHALGRVAAVEPVIEAGVACSALLAGTVNGESRLEALLSGEALFTTSLATGAETTTPLRAASVADGYELHGTVAQLPLAPDVDYFLLVADCDGEPGLFVVPRAAAGVSLEALTLADGTRDGRVHLDAVRCPTSDRLHTTQALPEVLERARALAGLGASAYLLGLGESLLDITAEYLRVRRQFGRPIGSFQALQHRLVDMYLHLRLSKAALSVALAQGDEAATPALTLMAARARHRACATTTRIVREAIQLHGAIGYTEQCDVSLYVQRALVMSARFGGARTVLAASSLALGAEGDAAAVLPPPLAADFRPVDGDWNSLDDALFRSTVRHWIEANYPAELRHVPDQLRWSEIKGWHAHLVAQGWAAPAWPTEYGGPGWSATQRYIYSEELAAASTPPMM